MTADRSASAPIACTLDARDYQQRLAWIADLNRTALRAQHRDGLRLELTYAPAALDRVWALVARERACCAFLTFDVRQEKGAVRLIIEAPDDARDALDAVFAPFLMPQASVAACGCSSASRHARC
jgi:hypothetical protein